MTSPPENPFADTTLAARYEDWYSGPGREADQQEKSLVLKLLADFPNARCILDVGCGTGHFTRWFRELGFEAVGLDSSPAMLAEARRRDGGKYVDADSHRLPYPDRSFDLATLITTLEFVQDPSLTLKEAARVARHGLVLGVLNRHSLLTWRYRRSGNPLWNVARFFTPGDLVRLVRRALGNGVRSVRWRTTLWP